MDPNAIRTQMTARLVDQLYVEAMLLADEARAYFDGRDHGERERMSAELRVAFACESLRVTTRLMHVIAWLLNRKAEAAGELDPAETIDRRLGVAAASDPDLVARMPDGAREVILSSTDLYARVARLDHDLGTEAPSSPARTLLGRLEGARF